MKKVFAGLLAIAVLVPLLMTSAWACTSFVLKAKDGSPVYGRTLEWGLFDFKSDLVMVPRDVTFTAELGGGKRGMTWKNKYGFVAINALNKPFYVDGMNETGLIIGALYLPGFAKFQALESGKESSTLSNGDLMVYVLGRFETVKDIKAVLPDLRVVENEDANKEFGAPTPVHYVVVDSAGDSIVIEYVDGELNIYDNTIGIMTNSPPYDWHLLNLRNYTRLDPYAPAGGNKKIDGVDFMPLGGGAGMAGLPGDYTSPSRFIRAFFYKQTSVPLEDADTAVNQAFRILDNFDIPKGFLREGESPENYFLGYTQWSVIGDIKNKRYYWWTEWNRRMRMVDLTRLNFEGSGTIETPLDRIRAEDIDDRTADFLQ
ncbi:MAG: hypothetical protein A2Z72_01065 [Omnitrophica bacterium RBG_13_46_9]|nr:MAG: hypothetical protein A2Z72_01065 [Omnitrophica bacterium RBG_13_46_9]